MTSRPTPQHSGQKLEYVDTASGERYVPHVIEPAAGADRAMLAFLVDAYDEDEIGGEARTVLRLHPQLAPVKVAVLPLVRKDGQPELAQRIYKELRERMQTEIDSSGAIGRRYRRQDEIGTPYAVTIDHQSLEDETVTVRDRDSLDQQRVPIAQLAAELEARLRAPWTPPSSPMTTRSETIAMPDGGEMGAYVALPESGSGPGMLVLMEIFGVGVYIREVAERLAAQGYVALAPDLYRRVRPGAEFAHDDAGLQQAYGAVSELDVPGAIEDAITALDHLRGLPETTGPGRRARLLPRRDPGLRGGATGGPGDGGRVLRLRRGRHARRQRGGRLPGAVPIRRRRSLHRPRAGRAGGGRRAGPRRLGVPHPR